MNKLRKWLPWIIGLAAFIYLALLCTRDYSWVFISSDGGDWLASAVKWMVPQPYGAPLYILLGHLVNFLFPQHLPIAMAILLAALPTAVTVSFVYLSVLHFTSKLFIAIVCSLLTLGSAVLLTQATTIGYHAIAVMFLTLAFYMYLLNKHYLTVLFLALGTAIHIIVLPIAIFWLIADRRFHLWLKPILLYVLITLIFYALIPLLMYLPTPRFLAGSLTLASLESYWTQTSRAIVGQVSIFETPRTLLFALKIFLMSFGLAIVPIWYTFKRPISHATFVLLGTIVFVSWYFITCLDSMVWTYMSFATPSVFILAGLGLSRLPSFHIKPVLAYSLIILILNPIFMNANVLTEQNPLGRDYLDQLSSLPPHSVLITDAGALSLGMFYMINTTRSDLVPIVYPYLENPSFFSHDYENYINITYHLNLNYSTTLTAAQSALDQHIPLYYTYYSILDELLPCFDLAGPDEINTIRPILSLTGLDPLPFIKWQTSNN